MYNEQNQELHDSDAGADSASEPATTVSLWLFTIAELFKLAKLVLYCGTAVIAVSVLARAWVRTVMELAGKQTDAKIDAGLDLSALAEVAVEFSRPAPITYLVLGLAAFTSWRLFRRECQRHRETIRALAHYRRLYEGLFDPDRSSSGLSAPGGVCQDN